jgi:5'-3' exonuclease
VRVKDIPDNASSKPVSHPRHSQGLTSIDAPGEAEATCAALNALGLVDGVHTKDSDAFLFGAETVYKSMKLVDNLNDCKLDVFNMEAFRNNLGIATGGSSALIAMAVLIGGDYHLKGAEVWRLMDEVISPLSHPMQWLVQKVGPEKAFQAIKTVLRGAEVIICPHRDDSRL